jgi:hypothetical protein
MKYLPSIDTLSKGLIPAAILIALFALPGCASGWSEPLQGDSRMRRDCPPGWVLEDDRPNGPAYPWVRTTFRPSRLAA